MPIAGQLSSELAQMNGIPDSGVATFVVGSSPSIPFSSPLVASPSYTLSRQPSGGTAAINASTGIFSSGLSLPGLYQVSASNGVARVVNLVAVPAGLLALFVGNSGRNVTLSHVLQFLVQTQGSWSATTFAASVENANYGGSASAPGASFGFNGILTGGASAQLGVNWALYL
jgi:hypothetical protein